MTNATIAFSELAEQGGGRRFHPRDVATCAAKTDGNGRGSAVPGRLRPAQRGTHQQP